MSLLVPQLLRPPRRSQMLHTCVECGFVTPRRRAYEKHMRACESARSASGRTLPDPPVCRNYRCHHCGSCTNKAKLFLYHLRDVHGENMSVFACDLCEYASRHKHKVFRHRKLVHKGAAPLTDLLPVESGDSQDAMMEEEAGENGDYALAAGQFAERLNRDLTARDGRAGAQFAEENGDNMMEDGESTAGVYVVNPEPVDDDIDVAADDVVRQHPSSGVSLTFASLATHGSLQQQQQQLQQRGHHHQQQALFKCRMCPYTNPYKWKIAQHARTVHMRKTLFRCTQCDFTCERKIEWCVHKTRHSKKAVHSCDECAYSTTMKRNFDRHMRRHSNGGPIKCGLCTYASTGEAAVQRHMAEFHHNAVSASAFGVIGTGAKPSTASVMSSSSSSVTSSSVPASLLHTLPTSLTSAYSQQQLSYSALPRSTPSDDDDDDDDANDDDDIGDDEDGGSNRSSPAIGGDTHPMEDGSSSGQSLARLRELSSMNNHPSRAFAKSVHEAAAAAISGRSWNMKQQQDEEQPLDLSRKDVAIGPSAVPRDQPLDLSGPAFGDMNNMTGSSDGVKRESLYVEGMTKCPHCNYSASWPSDLQRHMMVHSVERRCRCYLCGRRYKHQFDLNAHLRRVHRVMAGRSAVQLGTVPGPVSSVGNGSNRGGGHVPGAMLSGGPGITPSLPLLKPIASYGDARGAAQFNSEPRSSPVTLSSSSSSAEFGEKLRCEYCNYVGKYRAEVERHMRLHTGDKPFACLFCSYRSFWKGDMKRHLVKHHPNEVGGCPDIKVMVNDTEILGQKLAKEENSNRKAESPAAAAATALMLDDRAAEEREGKLSAVPAARASIPLPPLIVMSGSSSQCSERQVFKCSQCPFQCDAPSKLKCHAEIHANLKRFKCPECGKRSNWTWDIRKHIRKDHPNMSLEVIEMTEEEAKATLSDYVSTHRTCGRSNAEPKESTPIRDSLQQRVGVLAQATEGTALASAAGVENGGNSADVSMEDASTAPLRPFKCSECPKRSNWKWDIQKHIRAVHAGSGGKVIVFKGDRVPASRSLASKYSPNKIVQPSSLSLAPYSRPLKPLSLQPSDMMRVTTERCRPFKCSECGKRSNWKWDLNKHIVSYHNNAAHIVTLTEDEARDTFDDYLRVQQKDKGASNISADDDDMVDFSEGNMERHVANLNVAISLLAQQRNGDEGDMFLTGDLQLQQQHHSKDANKMKKFKCYMCTYRSNFRSDIQRHAKRRHGEDILEGAVIELSDKEAAETLEEYHRTYGSKKFSSPDKLTASFENGVATLDNDDEESLLSDNNESARSNALSEDEHSFYQNSKHGSDHVQSDSRRDVSLDDADDAELWVRVPGSDMSASKGRGRHFCEWCPYVSINRNDYIYHKQFHRPQSSAAFKCNRCPYWVTQKRLLKQHEKVHQPEYKLRYYPSSRLTIDELQTHDSEPLARSNVTWSLGQAEDDEDLSSDTVDYDHIPANGSSSSSSSATAAENSGQRSHKVVGAPTFSVSPPTSGSGKTYKCRRCPYVCGSLDRLMEHKARHMLTHDDEGRPVGLPCARCDYRANSDDSLSVHAAVHTSSYRPGVDIGSDSEEGASSAENKEEEEWKCDQCPFHTMLYTRFEKHLLFHRSAAAADASPPPLLTSKTSSSSKSVLDDYLGVGGILSAVPADIAAAANLMTGGALLQLMDCADDGGKEEEEEEEEAGQRAGTDGVDDFHRGAAIFPGHSFDEFNTSPGPSLLSYDLNANVAKQNSNGIPS